MLQKVNAELLKLDARIIVQRSMTPRSRAALAHQLWHQPNTKHRHFFVHHNLPRPISSPNRSPLSPSLTFLTPPLFSNPPSITISTQRTESRPSPQHQSPKIVAWRGVAPHPRDRARDSTTPSTELRESAQQGRQWGDAKQES